MNHMSDDCAAVLPITIRFRWEDELNNLSVDQRLTRVQPDAASSDIGQSRLEYGTASQPVHRYFAAARAPWRMPIAYILRTHR
jgi:hypothetical protein